MNDEERKRRAEHAKRILEDELFHEAVKTVHDGYVQKMLHQDEAEKLLQCKHMITALTKVVGHLRATMETGKMADFRLAAIKPRKRA